MIERKAILDQPEISRYGALGVRIALLLVDGQEEIDSKWHRTSIPADVDPQAQMHAVNQHLLSMGYPAVSQGDIDCVVAAHTLMKGWLGL